MSATITIVGNLGDTPELRFTPGGSAVARFSVGVTKRVQTDGKWEDSSTSWYDCSAWEGLAENVCESLEKGSRVIVTGTFEQRTYEVDGEKRYAWGLTVRNIGIDLTFGTAKFNKRVKVEAPKPAPTTRRNTRTR